MLPGENINLIQETKEVGAVVKVMREKRNDPMLWEEIYAGAEEMAADCSMERNMPQATSNCFLEGT